MFRGTLKLNSLLATLQMVDHICSVALHFLEKQNALNFNSLRKVAEEVQGTFVFTVLDAQDNLYFVHGDNPLCLYHFPKTDSYFSDYLIKDVEQSIQYTTGCMDRCQHHQFTVHC